MYIYTGRRGAQEGRWRRTVERSSGHWLEAIEHDRCDIRRRIQRSVIGVITDQDWQLSRRADIGRTKTQDTIRLSKLRMPQPLREAPR